MSTLDFSNHLAAVICLAVFGLLGAFDGVYFHLIKFQLHRHKEALTEHLVHALRALIFMPIALLFFIVNATGPLLWLALAVVLLDLCAEVWDILIEKASRANIGGIEPAEAVVHVIATGFRMAALAFCLATKAEGAWNISAPLVSEHALPLYMKLAGYLMLVTSFLGAWSHILLLRAPGGVWAEKNGRRSVATRLPA